MRMCSEESLTYRPIATAQVVLSSLGPSRPGHPGSWAGGLLALWSARPAATPDQQWGLHSGLSLSRAPWNDGPTTSALEAVFLGICCFPVGKSNGRRTGLPYYLFAWQVIRMRGNGVFFPGI